MRKPTREVRIGSLFLGQNHPIVVQSMCATKTQDVDATFAQILQLSSAGAGIVRVAVDSPADADALEEIHRKIQKLEPAERERINLSVDLQENYRIASRIAPLVAKIRYNPGHLHHVEKEVPWREKVRWLVRVARENDIALRIGVNCGSIDPEKHAENDPIFSSALEHADWLSELGFDRFCVSLKDSTPETVLHVNRLFAEKRPEIPLHLGVTEAGIPPLGIVKSRAALEPLLFEGIGDTLRISLTVPNDRKQEEVEAGRALLADVLAGRHTVSSMWKPDGLNIISCPSCSRVQNARFVELAMQVHAMTTYAKKIPLTIAVMGCRVNGPGETDHADLGLWCGPESVNLKCRGTLLGSFSYDEILPRLKTELDRLIAGNISET
ncbi:MAG: flavodoxin/ferredoxin-dependent (E)-4-hydroxy-3-methylbut-2-enyl-diphosphate synthase [Planctomycetia bacterium]|nr:flavodoxin/ferredoxin-dependent (E)-4-hydroxy-3-methylbut-2-enyl-diphosphate synthase [Planctomycetia bacterium]